MPADSKLGSLTIRDDDPRYFQTLADPRMVPVASRQVAPGVREVTFAAGRAANPPPPLVGGGVRQMRLSPRYLQEAKRDYASWKQAWWREAIQNGLDAGARRIDLEAVEEPEALRVSCTDDGRGMDEATILRVYVEEVGTTEKPGEALGGFGRGKELLVLPWIGWEIHSREVAFQGQGGASGPAVRRPMLAGTRITVWMDKTQATTADQARRFLAHCHLPKVEFRVNGDPVRVVSPPGKLQTTLEGTSAGVGLAVYHDAHTEDDDLVRIRVGGLFMFLTYKPEHVPGRVTCELVGRSYDALMSNRDGFADAKLGRDLASYLGTLRTEAEKARRARKKLIRKVYRRPEVVAESADLARQIRRVLPPIAPKRRSGKEAGVNEVDLELQVLPATAVGQVARVVRAFEAKLPPLPAEHPNLWVPPEAVPVHLAQGFRTTEELEHAVAALAWVPDLHVVNEVENLVPPAAYLPGPRLGRIPLRLLRLWTEFCRFSLVGLGTRLHNPVGVGWMFHADELSDYRSETDPDTNADQRWWAINPLIVDVGRDPPTARARFRLSDEVAMAELFFAALHEVVHVHVGDSCHGERYAAAVTRATAQMFPRAPLIRKLRAVVAKIGAEGAGAQERVPAGEDMVREGFEWALRRAREGATAYESGEALAQRAGTGAVADVLWWGVARTADDLVQGLRDAPGVSPERVMQMAMTVYDWAAGGATMVEGQLIRRLQNDFGAGWSEAWRVAYHVGRAEWIPGRVPLVED